MGHNSSERKVLGSISGGRRCSHRHHTSRFTDPLIIALLILAVAVVYMAIQTVSLSAQLQRSAHVRATELTQVTKNVQDLSTQINSLEAQARTRDAFASTLITQDRALREALLKAGIDPNKIAGPLPVEK